MMAAGFARKVFAASVWALVLFGAGASARGLAPMSIPVTQDSGWTLNQSGRSEAWIDRRNLIALFHPWEESAGGDWAAASREVEIPADWTGPVRLQCYMTDDYDGSGDPIRDIWLGQINLVGHRFKQILVNDQVVWEADVADAEGVGAASRVSVQLPDTVRPGARARIAFRLLDKVGSSVRLPKDYRYIGDTDGIGEEDPWRFITHLYVGDVALMPGDAIAAPVCVSPAAEATLDRHRHGPPLQLPSRKVTYPVQLGVRGAAESPVARAIHCGIPFPPGVLVQEGQAHVSVKGKPLPVQDRCMNTWPDGSIRWLEIDTLLPPGDAAEGVSLDVGGLADIARAPLPPADPVSVKALDSGGFLIETGALRVSVGTTPGALVERMINGAAAVIDLTGRMQVSSRAYEPVVEHAEALASGPVRGEVELTGRLEDFDADVLGRFVFRLAAFAGQPYVRIYWRVFNERPGTLNAPGFDLLAKTSLGDKATLHWGGEPAVTRAGRVRQTAADQYEVLDAANSVLATGHSAPGWLGVTDGAQTILAAVRHFAEQFPKSLEYDPATGLRLALFSPTPDEIYYKPREGEAKRHEIWLGLFDEPVTSAAMTDYAAAFAQPPGLFDADYFCATGGLGAAYAHDDARFPELTEFMETTYGDAEPERFYARGIRNWGDRIYNVEENQWCNGYYDRQQGFAVEYLMTGRLPWFQHLEATVRHIIDVDVCYRSAEHPEWVGGIHAYYGADHSTGVPWNPTQRIKGTLAYWRLTADPDARDAALAVAWSAARNERGIGAVSVRDHAGILYCLTAAYDETGDPAFLDAARRVAHDAIGNIDARRGCYAEVHGNVSYRGNVPWMVAQLAEPLYDYYRQSGDVDAAVAVVGLADSILCENTTRGVPGDTYGYSHNPHFKKTSNYHILIAPALMYAYELSGDPAFLTHARAMYEQTIRERTVNSIVNCYWNTPTLLEYLERFKDQPGEAP